MHRVSRELFDCVVEQAASKPPPLDRWHQQVQLGSTCRVVPPLFGKRDVHCSGLQPLCSTAPPLRPRSAPCTHPEYLQP